MFGMTPKTRRPNVAAIVPRWGLVDGTDFHRLIEIDELSFERPLSRGRLEGLLCHRPVPIQGLKIEIAGVMAAYALFSWKVAGELATHHPPPATAWKLHRLAVAPHIRRRGLGTILVIQLQASAGEMGRIAALVEDDNFAAHKFFQRLGFTAEGVSRGGCDGEQDGYRFVWRGDG